MASNSGCQNSEVFLKDHSSPFSALLLSQITHSDDEDEEEESEGEQQWVSCELCGKWRFVDEGETCRFNNSVA